MTIINESFSVNTKGNCDIVDITGNLKNIVYNLGLQNAIVFAYAKGSTVSLTNIEYEPGLKKDLPEILDNMVPVERIYHHDDTWHDGNGHAHIRAAIIGNSVHIPLIDSVLKLGQWQQVVLIDFDNKARSRQIDVQIYY